MNKTKWHKFPDEKPDENRLCFVTIQFKEGSSYSPRQSYKFDKTGNCWINPNTCTSFTSNGIVTWTYVDDIANDFLLDLYVTEDQYKNDILPDKDATEDEHKDDFTNINNPSKSGIYICKTRQGTIGAYKYIKKCYRWYDIDDDCSIVDVTDDVIAYKEVET